MSHSAKVPLKLFRKQTGLQSEALYLLLENKALPVEVSPLGEILIDTTAVSTATLESALEKIIPELDLSENSVLAEHIRKILDEELEIIVRSACDLVGKRSTQ
jgi:hypothetical protein